ncbi:increased DNA methylation 2-like isoform X2 [Diospyros lotus]|uniref:increased DNA methylation 2-like isoform X2 n=1 Tax=Diospyros lotus TaxID=55363 RepID=UPI00225202A3|nr:increased DNA methylation 2-like isoform X2 [Diospyros lotus]
MEDWLHAKESHTSVGCEPQSKSRRLMPTDDQYFLLYFIMGTFFGPDLREEIPRKPVLQRLAEGLPSYTSEKLAGSHVKTVEVERVYYHVLRKADQSVIVKLSWLHQFLHGNLPIPAKYWAAAYPQFPDLFPPQLHPHSRFKNRYYIIENIVFINNPETFYIKPKDIERFKWLTGLEGFHLDRERAMLPRSVNEGVLCDVAMKEVESSGKLPVSPPSILSHRTRSLNDILHGEDLLHNAHAAKPVNSVPGKDSPKTGNYTAPLPSEANAKVADRFEPGMVFLPSPPTREEWINFATATRNGYVVTGTAATGHIGPPIGLVDIGECEDSYLFRVSLPGVKRDDSECGVAFPNCRRI